MKVLYLFICLLFCGCASPFSPKVSPLCGIVEIHPPYFLHEKEEENRCRIPIYDSFFWERLMLLVSEVEELQSKYTLPNTFSTPPSGGEYDRKFYFQFIDIKSGIKTSPLPINNNGDFFSVGNGTVEETSRFNHVQGKRIFELNCYLRAFFCRSPWAKYFCKIRENGISIFYDSKSDEYLNLPWRNEVVVLGEKAERDLIRIRKMLFYELLPQKECWVSFRVGLQKYYITKNRDHPCIPERYRPNLYFQISAPETSRKAQFIQAFSDENSLFDELVIEGKTLRERIDNNALDSVDWDFSFTEWGTWD